MRTLRQANKISKVKLFFCTICVCSVFCFCAPQAQALWFMDSISNLITKVGAKIQKALNTDQNVTATIMEWLNSKIVEGSGKESLKLYDEIAEGSFNLAKDISDGKYDVGDFSAEGVLDSLISQATGYLQQQEILQKMLEDTIKAEEKKKLDKKNEMEKELAILESQREALDALEATDENVAQMDELDKNIAEIRLAMKKNDEEQVIRTQKTEKIKEEMSKLGEKMEALNTQLSEKNLQNMLETESMKLFNLGEDKKALDISGEYEYETYEDVVEKLFLGEEEIPSSSAVKRIMNERKKEFYDAVINAHETVVKTSDDIERTKKRSRDCDKGTRKKADTVFGSMGLRQCVEMQNSLAAVGLLDILLATIRLEVTADFQKWDNKYRLIDYNKDMSVFNLDDYMMREEDVLTKLKSQVKQKVKKYLMF